MKPDVSTLVGQSCFCDAGNEYRQPDFNTAVSSSNSFTVSRCFAVSVFPSIIVLAVPAGVSPSSRLFFAHAFLSFFIQSAQPRFSETAVAASSESKERLSRVRIEVAARSLA